MKPIYIFLFIAGLFLNMEQLCANNPIYEARKNAYIDNALANFNGDAITIQAYKGVPVDSVALANQVYDVTINTTADFGIVKLVRVLMLSHGEYDSTILPALRNIPFWLEKNESLREYWSENHMIQWMSSDWLLHEKYGKIIDSTLEKRLRHYLDLKVQYGFYEFFSSTYGPYCLSGLLNLADFAQDAQIKSQATLAAQRLLKDLLKMANDKGTYFPAAGRNYYGKYDQPYDQNHNNLIYLLTGFGQPPTGASHAGGFLASSSIDVDDIINSWTPTLNTLFTLGHTLQDGISNINNTMSPKDKVIFQWSSGAYFDPLVAQATFQLVKDLNLWDHFEFSDFRQYSFLPSSLAPTIAEVASSITKSSGIYHPTIAIFKNKSVTLSSIQDFWKGKVGYQQWPVIANTGTTAVFTISGTPTTNWDDRPAIHANTHLPYVQQKDNIALVMYRPEKGLALFGYKDAKLDVALHWKNEKFDEVRESDHWILGREGNSYVAVRRECVGDINGVKACDNPDGQTWVIMVGNIDMYNSFDNFQNIIEQSQYEEKWYFNLPTLQWVYYSKIVVDGKTLEYAWNGDIFSGPTRVTTGIQNLKNNTQFAVYPNPAKDNISIDLSAFGNEKVTIKIINVVGQEIYNEKLSGIQSKTINTTTWAEGMYMINVQSGENNFTQKLLIKR
ncbi:MAG: hypothetical protein JWN78_1947 [Bacteroidota bacterium]|nr:hypothetical protein [Bacteroidota bacterium]